jgi:molybdate/tungstate transport system ATP-binding protein
MNVFRNIGYGLRIKKTGKDEINNIVRSTAQELDISHLLHRRIDRLSGGERQRVAIARTMVLEPEIYLFDEPTAALDISTRIKIQRLFMRLHKELRPTVIHVTHDFEEALALGDRVALLFDGRMVQIDTPEKVFNNPVTKSAADFLGYKNVLSGKIKDYCMNIDGVEIMTVVPRSDMAYIAVRANDIILSKEKILSSARNSFRGEVLRVIQRENYIEVVFDVGILLHVDITSQSRQELAVKPGQRLWATFKTVAVKVFEH